MLVGTGSDVGKSVLATALCRIFLQDGYRPAPFKAQNMSLNSYATPDGREIGRAQAVQAEACGLPPHVDMNPLLLKPNSDHTSQIVLLGKPTGTCTAYSYFRSEGREQLRQVVQDAFDRLQAHYNPVVMEGAGSVSELNLQQSDIVNMPMARHAKADVLLVADIERGGTFASCYGSIMLQQPEDRARIKGIIINKFRGDQRLFEDGVRIMEKICQVPVLGVVPVFEDMEIDEEDSMQLGRKHHSPQPGKVNVAVVRLPHISNFTDFDPLERDERIHLFYTQNPTHVEQADIIILPGTKSTLSDLDNLRKLHIDETLLQAHRNGKTIVGICGGYQMLGKTIDDPLAIEGSVQSREGLGLLSINTVMQPEKTTRQVTFSLQGITCRGYEIHQGVSTESRQPVLIESNCIGTYIHGLFDNPIAIDLLLKNHSRPHAPAGPTIDPIDQWAAHVRRHINLPLLYNILTAPC